MVLYSYELPAGVPSENNLYFILNNDLRVRQVCFIGIFQNIKTSASPNITFTSTPSHSLPSLLTFTSFSQKQRMIAWSGYLFFLSRALRKLPIWSGDVFRGIGIEHEQVYYFAFSHKIVDYTAQVVKDEYSKHRTICWNSFTSATPNQHVARHLFAKTTGIVFKIELLNGRDISKFSYVRSENEILISPNSHFLVTKGLHRSGVYHFVVMLFTF